jgi:hypothetical protein
MFMLLWLEIPPVYCLSAEMRLMFDGWEVCGGDVVCI